MKLKNKIRLCRFENGDMSQEALAKEIGVTRQTIHSIEKNKYVPSAVLVLKLARFFNKKVEDIFYLDENNNQDKTI